MAKTRIKFCKRCGEDMPWSRKTCPHCAQHQERAVVPMGTDIFTVYCEGSFAANQDGSSRQRILRRMKAGDEVLLRPDPNVPMKDSGVPWIGEIPAHWDVRRLKYVCALETGHTPSRSEPTYWVEDECVIPWVAYYTTGFQAGYLQSVTRDPGGLALTTTFSYDQYGNVTSIQDPRGYTTTITVDAENYPTEIQAPAPFNYRRKITYDKDRNVTRVEVENIDRKGVLDGTTPWIPTTLVYNEVDWLLSKTKKLSVTESATTAYAYDDSGFLTRVAFPEGNEQTIEYDERFLLFKVTKGSGAPEASTVRYDYDDNGNLATFTNGRGHAYDV